MTSSLVFYVHMIKSYLCELHRSVLNLWYWRKRLNSSEKTCGFHCESSCLLQSQTVYNIKLHSERRKDTYRLVDALWNTFTFKVTPAHSLDPRIKLLIFFHNNWCHICLNKFKVDPKFFSANIAHWDKRRVWLQYSYPDFYLLKNWWYSSALCCCTLSGSDCISKNACWRLWAQTRGKSRLENGKWKVSSPAWHTHAFWGKWLWEKLKKISKDEKMNLQLKKKVIILTPCHIFFDLVGNVRVICYDALTFLNEQFLDSTALSWLYIDS